MVSPESTKILLEHNTAGNSHTVFPGKLHPPAILSNCLPRARLSHRLESYRDTDLTLLCAPPGFGKTALLYQWYEQLKLKNMDIVWLTMDEDDGHTERFLMHIASALGLYRNETGLKTQHSAAFSCNKSSQCLLEDIYNALCRKGKPIIIMLDAYDQVDSGEFDKAIDRFQLLMPDNLHLAIAGRRAPPELATRLWAQNKVNSIIAEDLCLTEQEVMDLLGEKVSMPVSAYVFQETRGWPVAVQLFQKVLIEAGTDLSIKDETFQSRTLAPIREYIWEQVVKPLSDIEQQTLLTTSLLQEIDSDLANRLCQSERSATVLYSLARLQPLISRQGKQRRTYSVNPLLRDCLQACLGIFSESELKRILVIIIDWYIEKYDIPAAMRYVRLYGDPQLCARSIECFGANSVTLQAGITVLRAVLEKITAADIAKSTRLTIAHAVVLMKDGHLSLARYKLDKAKLLLEQESPGDDRIYSSSRVDYIAATYLLALYNNENFNRDYLEQCEIEAYRHTADDGLIGFVHALKSLLYQRNSSFLRAETEANKSLRYYKTAKSSYGVASVYLITGLCGVAKGQLHLAARSYENAQAIIKGDFADDPGLNAIADSLCAEIKYERNHTENLFKALEGAVDVLEAYDGWLDTYAVAYRIVISLALMQHDFESAHMFLDRVAILAGERGLEEINRLAMLWRINVCIREEKYDTANSLYTQYSQYYGPLCELDNKQAIWREYDEYHFTTARLWLIRKRERQALALLEPLIHTAHKTGRLLSLARAHILQSQAYQMLGMREEAIAVLRHAVTVGCSEKYMRVFLDEGDCIVPMLQHIVDSEKRRKIRTKLGQYCSGIISAFKKELDADKAIIPLTPRERQILTGLSHGNSNKIIARDLGVTESTIKFHLQKIYSKLGVNKRSTAVVEAKRLQIIH